MLPEPVIPYKLYMTDGLLNGGEDTDDFLEELIATYGDKKDLAQETISQTKSQTKTEPIRIMSVNLG